MITIGIVGMGRMGQAIAGLLESKPDISFISFQRISPDNQALLKNCDVAIEFTTPDAAPEVIRHCLDAGVPVISGTTGWHEYHLPAIFSHARHTGGVLLYATNFSVGMNIVFELNKKLASAMKEFPAFRPAVKEAHHIHKKDIPSGTAYTLLEDILTQHTSYYGFTLNPMTSLESDRISVEAIREGEIKGLHEVSWQSVGEKITIIHEAFDRKIFAEGAVMAALWLTRQKPGIYTMKDIIQI